jgi:hypothetical protein
MVEDRRGVVVGLDVHKSSVRLAALRDGELVRDVTFGYDHEQLLGEVRVWPDARVCQEARPTGFGCHRALVATGCVLVTASGSSVCATSVRYRRRVGAPHAVRGSPAKRPSFPASTRPSMTTCSPLTRSTGLDFLLHVS